MFESFFHAHCRGVRFLWQWDHSGGSLVVSRLHPNLKERLVKGSSVKLKCNKAGESIGVSCQNNPLVQLVTIESQIAPSTKNQPFLLHTALK